MKNPKLFLMILLYVFGSKDELYLFLIQISKNHGVNILQTYYDILDRFLPLPHFERGGIEFKELVTVN